MTLPPEDSCERVHAIRSRGNGETSRAELWLPLLRELTDRFPGWAVWKNVESALSGHGDVDSFAPPDDWPAIQERFLRWSRDHGLGPLLVCRHIPQGPHFVALEAGSPYLIVLDVKRLGTFRGASLIDVDDLGRLAFLDPRGFRRIRPGAEGVLKLVYNGMRPGGRKNPEGLRVKNVVPLLAEDPEGVREAARLFGRGERSILAAVEALLAGEWDRRALVTAEAWALVRASTEPGVMLGRLWLKLVSTKTCPVLRAVRETDRRIPGNREAWLADVARSHEFLEAAR